MEHKLDNHPNVEKWAYIHHDSDVDEDGKPVAPHIHLVVGLNESLNTSTIGNIIGVPQQYVCGTNNIRHREMLDDIYIIPVLVALSGMG